MRVIVESAPPAKDGAKSIRSPAHSHFRLTEALRDAIRGQVAEADRLVGVHASLSMHYERAVSRADALNLINGVADIIQRRGNDGAPWMIDDDANIRAFRYSESRGATDRYVIDLERLA